MIPPETPMRANPDERLLPPEGATSGTNRYLAPLGACLIYAILLAPVLLDVFFRPQVPPPLREIPVEIVVEPPKEKPPQPRPEPPKPAKQYDEAPARDAPRAANNDKIDTDVSDKVAKAAPTAEPNESPSPNPDKDKAPSATSQKTLQQPEQNPPDAAAAKLAEPAPTGELNTDKTKESDAHAEAKAQPEASAQPDTNRLPLFAATPGLDFGAMAKTAPIATGQAKATYLSIVYGLVMARMHFDHSSSSKKLIGTIDFSLDSIGNVIHRSITQPSGSRALDDAAYAAVGSASPFPRPPDGAPIGLEFTYTTE
jgi:protein TonB